MWFLVLASGALFLCSVSFQFPVQWQSLLRPYPIPSTSPLSILRAMTTYATKCPQLCLQVFFTHGRNPTDRRFHEVLIWSPTNSVRIAGELGGWTPYLTLPTPLSLVKIRPRGESSFNPHLSFAEVGMLLDSHFLLMQSLKYLQCDDLNVFLLF